MIKADQNHPVMHVYNQYYLATKSVRYFQAKLRKLERKNFWLEWIIAIFTSSSIASFFLWHTTLGSYFWKIFGLLAVILSISKPLLNYSGKIRRNQGLLSSYKGILHDLEKIRFLVRRKEKYDDETFFLFLGTMERLAMIDRELDVDSIDRKLVKKIEDEIRKELSSEEYYIPPQ